MMGFHNVADLARYSGNTVMYTGTLWNRNMILFRVGYFRQKNYPAEDGIDGTNGYFRMNSDYSAEQKTL